MLRLFSGGLLVVWLLLYGVAPALAHKVRVFAWIDGIGEQRVLVVEGEFNGGRPAMDSEIILRDALQGEQLASGRTDAKGVCRLPLPKTLFENPRDIMVVLNAGDGHQARWPVGVRELAAGGGENETIRVKAEPAPATAAALSSGDKFAHSGELNILSPEYTMLRRIVAEELAAQLGPIRRDLAAMQEQETTWRDILGGIGYIFGLAGVAAWSSAHKKGGKQ